MGFPPGPVDTIDWNDIGFRVREVNGHIESRYSVKTGKWTEPEFVQDPFLRIHGLAPGLNYGQQAYEGMKAFRDPSGQVNIFRPTQNAERLAHSASFVSIPPVPSELFLQSVRAAVAVNAEFVPPHHTGAAMYIRPLIFGSCAQLGLNPPEEYMFVVYVLPVGVYHGVHPVDALILEGFDRAAPEGTGSAKVGGNYAPVLRWSESARKEGYLITLHLDSKTRSVIDEFSTSGFIGIGEKDGKTTLVVPDSKNVIKSVTSESCISLGESFGWTIERRPIDFHELNSFSEVLACGTAAALVPVKSITHKSSNTKISFTPNGADKIDEPGPACVKLLTSLKGIQQGKITDNFGWLDLVQEPQTGSVTGWPVPAPKGEVNGSVDKLP